MDLTPGETLDLRAGGQGEDAFVAPSPGVGGAGGGASDVRTVGDGIADRLLVAGGGGGAGPGGGDPGQLGDGGGSDTAAPISVTTTFP